MRGAWSGIGLVVCGIAAASLALPSVPTTDPWGWIIWGRELAGGELHTDVEGSPSWKPLPVVFTTVLSLLGGAAPDAWLFLARALGLAGVVVAFLAGRRLAGTGAGVVAALALVLAGGWVRGLEHGYSEPLLMSAVLGALLAWLHDRRVLAFWLMGAAALARPELWPMLGGLAYVVGRGTPRARVAMWAAVASVPVLWIGADWLGSGRPFNGSSVAATVTRNLSFGETLELAATAPVLPVLVFAAVGAIGRERLPVLLGAGALVWAIVLSAAVELGYPASERLMAPAVAAACVLAGIGAARTVTIARRPAARWAVAGALAVAALPFVFARAESVGDQVRAAERRAELQLDLRRAARAARRDAPEARSVALPVDYSWSRGAVAWEWRLPMSRVTTLDRPPDGARLFVFAPRSRRFARAHPVMTTRAWSVLVEMRGRRGARGKFASAHGG